MAINLHKEAAQHILKIILNSQSRNQFAEAITAESQYLYFSVYPV